MIVIIIIVVPLSDLLYVFKAFFLFQEVLPTEGLEIDGRLFSKRVFLARNQNLGKQRMLGTVEFNFAVPSILPFLKNLISCKDNSLQMNLSLPGFKAWNASFLS